MATQLDHGKDFQRSGWLEQRFRLSLRDSSVAIEFRAALATFMVMAYIIFANASILGKLADCVGRLSFFLPSDCLARWYRDKTVCPYVPQSAQLHEAC